MGSERASLASDEFKGTMNGVLDFRLKHERLHDTTHRFLLPLAEAYGTHEAHAYVHTQLKRSSNTNDSFEWAGIPTRLGKGDFGLVPSCFFFWIGLNVEIQHTASFRLCSATAFPAGVSQHQQHTHLHLTPYTYYCYNTHHPQKGYHHTRTSLQLHTPNILVPRGLLN